MTKGFSFTERLEISSTALQLTVTNVDKQLFCPGIYVFDNNAPHVDFTRKSRVEASNLYFRQTDRQIDRQIKFSFEQEMPHCHLASLPEGPACSYFTEHKFQDTKQKQVSQYKTPKQNNRMIEFIQNEADAP